MINLYEYEYIDKYVVASRKHSRKKPNISKSPSVESRKSTRSTRKRQIHFQNDSEEEDLLDLRHFQLVYLDTF